jgi:hypothetical protein
MGDPGLLLPTLVLKKMGLETTGSRTFDMAARTLSAAFSLGSNHLQARIDV